ncbi:MAG: hypothetical protein Q9174_003983 [Haloplaca sp. 1 TL-2023]
MSSLLRKLATLVLFTRSTSAFVVPQFDNGQVQPGCYNPPDIPQNLTKTPQRWREAASAPPILRRQIGKVWPGWENLEYLFTLYVIDVCMFIWSNKYSGDSYTSTSFNIRGTQPNEENPLGNPPYPGATSSDGPNYVDFLTTTYNQSFLRTYNLGYGGATIDPSLVGSPYGYIVQSFRQQVEDEFLPTYATNSGVEWTGSNSLFTVFFGINDVILSYGQRNSTLNFLLVKSYENLVHQVCKLVLS